jgi:two-component system, OmpR family, sensor histidine kinase KdpD
MQSADRPNPDALLARVQEDARRQGRGKLQVFFGMAPGVGKTYAMLQAAHQRKAEGADVVVGVIETHGRAETAALCEGLERLPLRTERRGVVTVAELDLDAALARRPQVLLVDELAHTNAPMIRHPKRYQDVQELLDAGIDVLTTINVQHLESLNDLVAQMTGVQVSETVPDAVIEQADAITLIDLPPEELLKRLREGKVYGAAQAARAQQHFFRYGNLISLRELALRKVAAEVDDDIRRHHLTPGEGVPWAAAQRLLVCVGPSPLSGRVVRVASRMAESLHAQWIAAHVEPPHQPLEATARKRVLDHLKLAEQLGARAHSLSGADPVSALLQYARQHHVTMIVVGRPTHARWRDLFRGSFVVELVRASPGIEVHVVAGDVQREVKEARGGQAQPQRRGGGGQGVGGMVGMVAVIALCTAVGALLDPVVAHADLAMLYLLGVAYVAQAQPLRVALVGVGLSVVAFNFFFVPPRYTFAVEDARYLLTFGAMGVVGALLSTLAARARYQARAAEERAVRASALYGVTSALSAARSAQEIAETAAAHLSRAVPCDVSVFLRGQGDEDLALVASVGEPLRGRPEVVTARWALQHRQAAGANTDNLPGSDGLYIPLVTAGGAWGALGLRAAPGVAADPDQRALIEALGRVTAAAIERVRSEEARRASEVSLEAERLRAALLSSISHDLRTPLGTIQGAAETLLDPAVEVSERTQCELIEGIHSEAERLTRLVQNLLEMTRFSAGPVALHRAWHVPEEVIGNALAALRRSLSTRAVTVSACDDLSWLDALLIERVLVNLIDNALKYTPAESPIEVTAARTDTDVRFEVRDHGPGISAEAVPHLFEKFYRGAHSDQRPGTGLGLAISKAIIDAHQGEVWVVNAPDPPGAVFGFSIPSPPPPPLSEDPDAGALKDAQPTMPTARLDR